MRVFQVLADGTWPYYSPGGVGVGVPIATGVLSGLGKLGAKGITSVVGANVMTQTDIDEAVREINKLSHPSYPTDGTWKNGKSPCAQ